MRREELATVRGGRSNRELVVAQQLAQVRRGLPRPGRVLEVGCGKGELAAALAAEGYRVTAIDPALPHDIMEVRGVHFLPLALEAFTAAEPFDAVAFTASLHHVDHLGAALDQAAAVLAPGGALIVDDFDLRAPDQATAHWYYELQELLAVALIYDPARIDATAPTPVARWLAAHTHHAGPAAPDRTAVSGTIDREHHLHSGAAMIEAIEARFDHVAVDGGPYLYRYISTGLRGPRAPVLAEAIRDAEQRRIDLGLMPPVGLQVIARRR
jgi:SAM-dependent methyltransferase